MTGDVTGSELAEVYQQSHMSVMGRNITCPLGTVCILLLDLVIALAKFFLVLVFSVEDTLI